MEESPYRDVKKYSKIVWYAYIFEKKNIFFSLCNFCKFLPEQQKIDTFTKDIKLCSSASRIIKTTEWISITLGLLQELPDYLKIKFISVVSNFI
jgi:hypothetical protein